MLRRHIDYGDSEMNYFKICELSFGNMLAARELFTKSNSCDRTY